MFSMCSSRSRSRNRCTRHLHHVRAEALPHDRLHDGELLDEVEDVDVALADAEVALERCVGDGHDARRPVPAEVHRHAVGLAVRERSQNPLA
jgi:hypothetical protein